MLFFSLNLKGNNDFEFKGSLGLEFSKRSLAYPLRSSLKENEEIKTTHLDLYFKSHFWRKDLLRYILNLNLEKGEILNSISSGKTDNFGYGIKLEFFPYSRKKFSLFASKQNYLYDKNYGFDYERKIDGFGGSFLFSGFQGNYKNIKSRVPDFKELERLEEEGILKKNFIFKNSNLFTELKRNAYDFKYFNTSQSITSALFAFNSSLKENTSIDGRLNFQEYNLKDKGFDLEQNLSFLNFGGSYTTKISSKTQSIFNLRGSRNLNGEQNYYNAEEILRFSLKGNFQFETLLGFVYERGFLPLGGLGVIYQKKLNNFNFFIRSGISYRNEENENFERKEYSPFANFSFFYGGSKLSSSLDIGYYSINFREFDFSYEELPQNIGQIALISRDDFNAKFQFNFFDNYIYNISFKTIYNKFESQYFENDRVSFNSFLHQIDFSLSSFKLGLNYYEGKEEGLNINKIKSTGGNFSINLGRNLSLYGSFIEREKDFLKDGKEGERNLQIAYLIGKFSLRFWFQGLEYQLQESKKKVDYFRIVVIRNFGNSL